MRHIGILLFDNVEELDAVGPWEVLAYWCKRFPEDGWAVHTLSRNGGVVHCSKGMDVLAQHSFADAPASEILIHPGGAGTRPLLTDPDHLDWVRAQRATVPLMASVCTGSMVYAAAGLLRGRPATSHWSVIGEFAGLDPTVEIRPDDRFVDDGDVLTSAGVSAGIDMALHIVARFGGADHARTVRRGIQYDPLPPV
ncbi:thiamine biosynthesis protein ThiJ [Actinophytocola xinjiangensis]|uniref:Thiamine biosynthesis protein ThiJ n=1 Tax=Actinophytocola xinjiangensis TaxID=485602 RepID=A0A7Z1AWX2_9PSEU|nr:DJ-1/PfpI family protein [Actinophytocola xinjiangensis]OLF09420.1 thiamine biosynthesis protein ThiJ [Actinophytocola xinjiangensis]